MTIIKYNLRILAGRTKNCKKLNWDTFMLIFAIKYRQSSLMNTIEQKIGVIDVFIQ